MRIFNYFIFVLFLNAEALAISFQRDSTILYFGGQAHYGFIVPHAESIRPLVKSTYPWGVTAEFSYLRYTQTAWDACNCYSQNGIALTYFNFDNPAVLGSSINLTLFAEPQLLYGNFNVSFRVGLGLSYLTRLHDPDTNPDNIIFSTPVSGLIQVQVNSRMWLTDNWALRLSGAYYHISNGGRRQPNLGMNFPTINLGAEYSIGRTALFPREKYNRAGDKLQYYAGFYFTSRNVSKSNPVRRPVLGLTGGFFKPFARMHAFGLAAELVNDWSLKERNRQSAEYYDHRIISGLLRHHFLFGKFDFSQALGIYVYKKYPTRQQLFQRYVLQYSIWDRVQLGFSLKAHLYVAEQMDVRVGYLF